MKYTILYCLFLFLAWQAKGQKQRLSLQETIERAQSKSIDAFRAKYMVQVQTLDYMDYKKSLLPTLNLSFTPANYSRSITEIYNSITQKYESVEIQRLSSSYGFSLAQPLKATGGNFNIYSGLTRSQQFNSEGKDQLDYSSTPLSLGYSQSLFGSNAYKWEAKIAPLEFEQAQLEFIEKLESISLQSVQLFFNLLTAQTNLEIAELNLANADTLLSMGEKRMAIASISRDDYLNLKLKQVNARISRDRQVNTVQNARVALCDFLSFSLDAEIECRPPLKTLLSFVDPEEAQHVALRNNPDLHDLKRQLLVAERSLEQVKRSAISANLNLGFGYNQFQETAKESFQNLLDRQSASLSFRIPIVDWNNQKRDKQRAQMYKDLVEHNNKQTIQDIGIQISEYAREFNLCKKELASAASADTLSQMAYQATQKRFVLGKVNVVSINEAYQSLYAAKNSYLSALKSYWFYYFTMRKLCLYDFEKQKNLEVEKLGN